MPTRPKYDSSRDRDNYTFHPGRQFNLEYLPVPGACRLYALDHRQATMLRRMLAVFPKYHWIWGLPSPRNDWDAATEQLWEDISDLIDETEACLVGGCEVELLLTELSGINRAIRELTAVVGSQVRDFTIPIPDNVDYSETGITYALYDDQGERLANFIDQIEENLAGINANLVIVNNGISTVNQSLNESFNIDTEGGLPNNINERLRNINISFGGFIDGVDLIGIAESLTELNKIRTALETTVVTQEGVQRQGLATAVQEQADNLAYILDRIRDNLDVSIFDPGEQQIKEYSITAALYTRITEFIEIVDKIRDNLDAVVDVDTEMGLAGMMDAMNLTAARINHNLRCVADSLNAVCDDTSAVTPPYLGIETGQEEIDFEAELMAIREDLISDGTEGRVPWIDETDEDHHIADGTFTLIDIEHTAGPTADTGYLLIDVATNGKCELIFNVQGTSRTMITSFLTPQEQVQMQMVPDTGTLLVLNEATGDTTSINW